MVRILGIASLALAVISAVSGHVIKHRGQPPGWETALLESYDIYHARYIELGCPDEHDTPFFHKCCHPLLRNETVSALDGCFSNNSDCGDESSSVLHPTPYSPASPEHYTPTSSSEPYKPSSSPTVYPTPSPELNKFVEHSSAESTSTPSPSPSPTNTGSGGGDWHFGGQATFFFQNNNAGACGQVHQDSDFVAAMDSAIFNQNLCGKRVQIVNVANGNSVIVTVADECPTCNNANSIDLSVAAFKQLADTSVGVIVIKWQYV